MQREAMLAELPPSLRLPIEAALAESSAPGMLDELALRAADRLHRLDIPPESLIGQHIGGFELIALLGVGGMSWVYVARREQGGAEQQVALKRLRPDLASVSLRRRFTSEQRIVARLQHPGIARLIAAGVDDDGTPWLATELIEGQPLPRWCDERRLPLSQRLGLFIKICEAVAAAHRQLIVHRDLKPGNVLIGNDGEPKLLDFGISRLLDGEDAGEGTRAEWRLLTPEYAAPEQLAGAPPAITMDVYALGVMLYELLCGARPSPALNRNREADLPPPSRMVREEAAVARNFSLSALRKKLHGDLDAIALHALEFDPERRYASVESFIRDLRAVLLKTPISLRRHPLYPAWRFVQRNQIACALAMLVLLAIGLGITAVLRESQHRQQAMERAVATERFLLGLFGSEIVSGEEAAARTVLDVLDEGAQQALATRAQQPELASRMLIAIASLQDQLDLHTAALANFDEAHAAAQQAGDLLLLARARLGRAHVMAENHEAPEPIATLVDAALPDLRRYADDSRELASGLNLAALSLIEEDPNRTESLFREALGVLHHGETDPSKAAEIYTNLGSFLMLLPGQRTQTIEVQRAAYELVLKHMGPDRILTHRIGFALGQALFRNGQWDEAQRLFDHTGQALERLLPPAHRDRINFNADRARLAARFGNLDQADAFWNRALAVARSGGDVLRPEAARIIISMGVVKKLRGDAEAALRDVEAGWQLYQDSGVMAGAGACGSRGLLARMRIDAGHLDDGLALLDTAPPSCNTPFIEEARAHAEWMQGRHDEAKSRYAALLASKDGDPMSIIGKSAFRLNFARLLMDGGESEAARVELNQLAAAFAAIGYPDALEAVQVRNLLERLGTRK